MILNDRNHSILLWLVIAILLVMYLIVLMKENIGSSIKRIQTREDHSPTAAVIVTDGRYSVMFVRPVYLSTGVIVEGKVQVFSEDMMLELSKLACAEGGIADRFSCRYGSCALTLSRTLANWLNEEESHPMTITDYEGIAAFTLANVRQVWYAGVSNSVDSRFVMWYRISAEVEDLMATTALVNQRVQCERKPTIYDDARFGINYKSAEWFVWRLEKIPVCGERWRIYYHLPGEGHCENISKEKIQADWVPLCRWRPNDSAQWRLFSTRPQYNIFNVELTKNKNEKFILPDYENTTLTMLLPQENLNYQGTIPTDIRSLCTPEKLKK